MPVVKIGSQTSNLRLDSSSVIAQFVPTVVPDAFESLSSLQTLISNASDGATIDLGGASYRVASVAEANSFGATSSMWSDGITVDKNIAIENGSIYGCIGLSWTSEGGGIFSATLPTGITAVDGYEDPRAYLVDLTAKTKPLLYVEPLPPDQAASNPWYNNRRWVEVKTPNSDPTGAVSRAAYDVSGVGNKTIDRIYDDSAGGGIAMEDSLRDEIDAILSGEDLSEVSAIVHGGTNQTNYAGLSSWSYANKELVFESGNSAYPNTAYLTIAFTGLNPSSLPSGYYCFRKAEGKIYYRPSSGDPSNAMIPCLTKVLDLSSGKTLTLNSVEITGSLIAKDPAAGSIVSEQTSSQVVMTNCTMQFHGYGIRTGQVTATSCVFDVAANRHLAGVHPKVEKCWFGDAAQTECIFAAADTITAANPAYVRKTFLRNQLTTHGQAISAYQTAWQNFTIENNIFYNCRRPLAYQANDATNQGTFLVANNLFVMDSLGDDYVWSGQSGIAFNGANDSGLTSQVVKYLSNTVWILEELVNDRYVEDSIEYLNYATYSGVVDTINHTDAQVLFANNIGRSFRKSTATTTNGGQCHLNNANYSTTGPDGRDNLVNGYGRYDLPTPGDLTTVFDESTLTPLGDWLTAATDGGSVGVRWTTRPSLSNIASINTSRNPDWSDDYIFGAYPVPSYSSNALDLVYANEDNRP
jgi:hypothetical protein